MAQFNHQDGRFINIGDARIYVEEKGAVDAFPIVFLHGGLGSIEDFGPLLEKLKGNFRFIGIDSRGHGKSSLGSAALSYELLEGDVEIVLESLRISKCCLIGFSDGGVIAYRMAIKNPLLTVRIITIGADWNAPSTDLQTLFSGLTSQGWENKFPKSLELYRQLNPEPDFSRLLKSVVHMWLDSGPSGYPNECVKEIHCETLVIRGDEDHFIPRKLISDMDGCLPVAKFFNIPFAGHATHVDQSEVVSIIVNQFLSPLIKNSQ
jgi:pimeloyl-ACP methyl ester carboxylesterase